MTLDTVPDKRAAVLQAALDLISEHGFHGTPMSQVAQAANVGVGTIYRYFANKEDLINALYTDIKSRITQSMLRGYSDALPIRVRFITINYNLIHYYIDHPKELRFVEQYANSPFITNPSREASQRMMEPIAEFFGYAQAQEAIKKLPLEIMVALVYGGAVSLVKLHLSGAVVLDEPKLEQALEALWDTIKR
jgi:AcrR family transcriptional regulator